MEDFKNFKNKIPDLDYEYFEKRPMLWNFGEKFVEYVLDYTITNFLKQLDGTGHPQGVKIMKNMTDDFSPQQIERLKKIWQCAVFNSLSAMLDFFETQPQFTITATDEQGQQIDLLEISDSISSDMIGESSCVAFLSKYKEIASPDFLQEYSEEQNKIE